MNEIQLNVEALAEFMDKGMGDALDFVVLETVRQGNPAAFSHLRKTLLSDANFASGAAALEARGVLKILGDYPPEEIGDLDLRQPYLELFKAADDVSLWIDEWRMKFPSGIKSGGYPLRGDKAGCLVKMRAFVRKHKYSKETIFAATDRYLDLKRREGWRFTQLAHYFISKDGQSTLAVYCEDLTADPEPKAKDDYTVEV